ncbi:Hydrogenase maturation factor [Lachnospiraceae bacterium C10]|nr:Hydrogenase maturation factor [Lachnospiraceae bacterium C10]SDW12532.1 Hydrogenase maturation factor [Lachnospiraceae bacterium KHCPX20]
MEIGKVPESVLKRSVFKQITTKRPEVILGSGVGEDCGALELKENEIFVVSTDPITGTAKEIGNLSVLITVNDLASSGAEAIGILLTVLLPDQSKEKVLREIMEQVGKACEEAGIQVIGGHTEVTGVVNQPLVSVTGIGKVKKGHLISTAGAKPGMDLIVTKWIGIEGTTIIAKEKEEELCKVFPAEYVKSMCDMSKYLSVQKDGVVAAAAGAAAMHDITEGGIFGALWEIAGASNVGLDVDLSLVPIRQETVELCDHYKLNPYGLISSGSMLIAAENGGKIVRALEEAGIPAAIIGQTTSQKAKAIRYDGQTRYLEQPKSDEFHKVLG